MNQALRKGWCPGALRPMAARDGLLVRLRLTGGVLHAGTAHALADLSTRHGNGLFDLSARANLQIRGVSEESLPALHDGLRSLDVLDDDAAAESIRNVMASPLAGLHSGLDIRPLVGALGARLVRETNLHALPSKFGILIDDGHAPTMAYIDADIRFDWQTDQQIFAIRLGGTAATALQIDHCPADDLVDRAIAVAQGMVALLAGSPNSRRMRDLIATLGPDTVARACGGCVRACAARPHISDVQPRDIVGLRTFEETGCVLGLAAPFGRLDAKMLRAAATYTKTTWLGELRLTPWRVVLIPGAESASINKRVDMRRSDSPPPCGEGLGVGVLAARFNHRSTARTPTPSLSPQGGGERATAVADLGHSFSTLSEEPPNLDGFITNPTDPRLRIAACVGAPGCTQGTTMTQVDAAWIASQIGERVPATGDTIAIHVSGCAKGCAKPSSTRLTLVARDGRYDLVRDGRAGDVPARRGLDRAEACDAILEPA